MQYMLSNYEYIGGRIPLTEAEQKMLRFLFYKRLRIWIVVFVFLSFAALYALTNLDFRGSLSSAYKVDGEYTGLTHVQMYALCFALLEGMVIILTAVVFLKRIYPFRKDLKYKMKEAVFYKVVQKEIFPGTQQYFIGLNNPRYLFHEVSPEVWRNTEVGDDFPLYRAPYSKYVFNKKGKYTVM